MERGLCRKVPSLPPENPFGSPHSFSRQKPVFIKVKCTYPLINLATLSQAAVYPCDDGRYKDNEG